MTEIKCQTLKHGLVGWDFKKVIFLKKRGKIGAKNSVEEPEAEHTNYWGLAAIIGAKERKDKDKDGKKKGEEDE